MEAEVVAIVLVVCLLGAAAALATPKGRVPLALRGVWRMMKKDRGEPAVPAAPVVPVPAWRKAVAFLLVILAALLVLA